MDTFHDVIQFIRAAGDRIHPKSGAINDIGIAKQFVTEEDLRIEREFKDMMNRWGNGDQLFAEEENGTFPQNAERVWVLDPISGTKTFIKGLPHYGLVVSLMVRGSVEFALVYDPSVKELFSAYRHRGAFLNDKKIVSKIPSKIPSIILNISSVWEGGLAVDTVLAGLKEVNVTKNTNSFAVNYCHIACGRFDGCISLTKDVFPEVAGSLILKEAGGIFTNRDGVEEFTAKDRIFCGGSPSTHPLLLEVVGALPV